MRSFLNKFKGKKKTGFEWGNENKTLPSDERLETLTKHGTQIEPQQLISGCGLSIGKQREHNEDYLFSFSTTTGGELYSAPLGLFIVADGMGGHQYGEIASSTAVRTMAGYLVKHFQNYLINPSDGMEEPLQEVLHTAFLEAQRAVILTAPGSGTTLTAALVLGQQITIGHVGDSRAYTFTPDGHTQILTRDHSLVKRLQELGQLQPEEASAHPQRNVLYRAIGQGEILEPDIFTTHFPQEGYLLLCSDGLWSVIPEGTLYKIISSSSNLYCACRDLIAAANEAGGPDNISAVLIQLIG